MAVQRYISSSFWSDDWIDSLTVKEKLIYLYLLTNDSTSISGVYKLTVKRIKDDTGIAREEITDILQKFAANKKAYYVDEYIILPNWLKHQHLNNESVKLGTIRALKALPRRIITFLREPEHFYYDVDALLGTKKEAKEPEPEADTATKIPETVAVESEKAGQNASGAMETNGKTEQTDAPQNNTSVPPSHCEGGALPSELGVAPARHPQNPSKSAHDSDSDLDLKRDSLNSLDIPIHLERGGMCENQPTAAQLPAPEEPAPLSKKTQQTKKSSRFIKPTVEEIAEYCKSRHNSIDPYAFLDFYESKNWYVGKNKMTNWKAAVHTWEHRQKQYSRAPPTGGAPNYKQQNFNASSLPELFKQSRLEKPPDETAALEDVLF